MLLQNSENTFKMLNVLKGQTSFITVIYNDCYLGLLKWEKHLVYWHSHIAAFGP